MYVLLDRKKGLNTRRDVLGGVKLEKPCMKEWLLHSREQ